MGDLLQDLLRFYKGSTWFWHEFSVWIVKGFRVVAGFRVCRFWVLGVAVRIEGMRVESGLL